MSEATGLGQPLLLLTIGTHLVLFSFEDLQCTLAQLRVPKSPPEKAVPLDHRTPTTRLLLSIAWSRAKGDFDLINPQYQTQTKEYRFNVP